MIHIQIKQTIDEIIDLYYKIDDIQIIKIYTNKFNLKKLYINNQDMYDNLFDVIVEEI